MAPNSAPPSPLRPQAPAAQSAQAAQAAPATRPPVALTIAGSDPSGGAGIQADLKSFSALGAYGASVISALTAQNTRGVTGVHSVPAEFVRLQLDTLAADLRIDAIKIGMLANADIADVVAEFVRDSRCETVVLDPVMIATSGDRLLSDDAVAAIVRLLPLVSLITPNLPEAAALLGVEPATTVDEMRDQARALLALGAQRVLLKGGHLGATGVDGDASASAIDIYLDAEGEHTFTGAWIETSNTHGTGCTLSSAIAALRPARSSWADAVRDAKQWLGGAIAAADALQISREPEFGHGPVHHFYGLWR